MVELFKGWVNNPIFKFGRIFFTILIHFGSDFILHSDYRNIFARHCMTITLTLRMTLYELEVAQSEPQPQSNNEYNYLVYCAYAKIKFHTYTYTLVIITMVMITDFFLLFHKSFRRHMFHDENACAYW